MTVGAAAGDARAAVVDDLSTSEAKQILETEVEPEARLMSDEWKAFIAVGKGFAAHDTVRHSRREYVRGSVHVNSAEGFNARVRRTIAGVFHHISPEHADLYFHEIGFRWVSTHRHGTGRPADSTPARNFQNHLVARPPRASITDCSPSRNRSSIASNPRGRDFHQIVRSCLSFIKAIDANDPKRS
jgi:ISXO2-like transposase domain